MIFSVGKLKIPGFAFLPMYDGRDVFLWKFYELTYSNVLGIPHVTVKVL
jgi:hypothetical protein